MAGGLGRSGASTFSSGYAGPVRLAWSCALAVGVIDCVGRGAVVVFRPYGRRGRDPVVVIVVVVVGACACLSPWPWPWPWP
eukprot:4488075-Pyramimonas_sp.AAC.1